MLTGVLEDRESLYLHASVIVQSSVEVGMMAHVGSRRTEIKISWCYIARHYQSLDKCFQDVLDHFSSLYIAYQPDKQYCL